MIINRNRKTTFYFITFISISWQDILFLNKIVKKQVKNSV